MAADGLAARAAGGLTGSGALRGLEVQRNRALAAVVDVEARVGDVVVDAEGELVEHSLRIAQAWWLDLHHVCAPVCHCTCSHSHYVRQSSQTSTPPDVLQRSPGGWKSSCGEVRSGDNHILTDAGGARAGDHDCQVHHFDAVEGAGAEGFLRRPGGRMPHVPAEGGEPAAGRHGGQAVSVTRPRPRGTLISCSSSIERAPGRFLGEFYNFLKMEKVELHPSEKGGKTPRKHQDPKGLLPKTPRFLPSSACGAGGPLRCTQAILNCLLFHSFGLLFEALPLAVSCGELAIKPFAHHG